MPSEQLVNKHPGSTCLPSSLGYLSHHRLLKIFCQVICKKTLDVLRASLLLFKELPWSYYPPKKKNFAFPTDKSLKSLAWNFRFSKIRSLFILLGLSSVLCRSSTHSNQLELVRISGTFLAFSAPGLGCSHSPFPGQPPFLRDSVSCIVWEEPIWGEVTMGMEVSPVLQVGWDN